MTPLERPLGFKNRKLSILLPISRNKVFRYADCLTGELVKGCDSERIIMKAKPCLKLTCALQNQVLV
jgi:hypothetical protein